MRKFWLIVIAGFLVSAIVHAQDGGDAAIQLKQFPKEGVLLDKGWTFYPGDDTSYAYYGYKGKSGVAINPCLLLDQLPEVRNSGLGWFRLKLKVDSSLRNKIIGITLSMLGAAEMYLNSELIYKFGDVSADYNLERTQAIPFQILNLKLGNEENQLLAIRYSYHKDNPYFKVGVIPYCLRIRVRSPDDNINSYGRFVKRVSFFNGIAICTEITAAVLTLFFFFSFRSRKEYLYFGIYFALQFFGTVFQSDSFGMGKDVKYSANQLFAIAFTESALFITASIFYLNGVYALFKKSRTKFYWFLVCYGFLSLAVIPFLPTWGGTFATLFFPLSCFEILPVYYHAMRIGFRGARTLFFSVLIALLLLIIFSKAIVENDFELALILLGIVLLTPALGLVIFLAGDFARTSLSLRLRIVEVEELSKKTIAQEKEKHEILAGQKDKLEIEVKERTAELTRSLAELKATQAQLIQQEKMASLGELTAGIAHEIQNPLNFVNNFSDVNTELIHEANQEIGKGNFAEVKTILNDLKDNEQKINHHGKRADSIVKGMLQHSRTSSGQKEFTDINALCDEYVRLAYHGLRAKDKSFNAEIKTEFDSSVWKINVVPQDIGRVILNLINNAFYAVDEKQKQNISAYEPTVSVTTRRIDDHVVITIADNGNGIPQKILNKIFQPFFTTKPTGQGTGLGLSLAYDIVKAHGGEIKVVTSTDEGLSAGASAKAGSEFVIQLPVS